MVSYLDAAQADLVAKRADLEAAKALLGSRERHWKGAIEERKAVPRDAPTATRVVMDAEVKDAKARVAEAKAARHGARTGTTNLLRHDRGARVS